MVKLLCNKYSSCLWCFLFLSIPNYYELRRGSLSSRLAGEGVAEPVHAGHQQPEAFFCFSGKPFSPGWCYQPGLKDPLLPVGSTGTRGVFCL
jgi:hypothetical protein